MDNTDEEEHRPVGRKECPGRAGLTEALPVGTVCPAASLPSQSSIPTKLSREMILYVEGVRFTQAFLLPFPLCFTCFYMFYMFTWEEFSPSHMLSENWWGHSDCETCSSLWFGSQLFISYSERHMHKQNTIIHASFP